MTAPGCPTSLAGLRVLDMSRVLAGPWAAQMLGDLGAEVIKIERPGEGDDTRGWGPPWLRDEVGGETSESAYFLCANRNKKSVTVDMAHPEGRKLLVDLAARSDILIENFKVGGLKKYGLDYDSLSAVNPRLIYCSITGFGQTGPYAQRAGYDFLIQAMGGLMSVTGRADGEPGAGPVKAGVAIADIMTGLHANIAILAALAHRTASGRGQHIDLSLFETQIAALGHQCSNYLVSGKPPARLGNAHPNIVPYQDFETADGSMIVAVGNDGQFAKLVAALGHPEWADDPRFALNRARVANRAVLVPMLQARTRLRTSAEWVAMLEREGVPCGPVNDVAAVFADPHVVARGVRIDMEHASGARAPLVANPIHMSETPVAYSLPPPLLGEHTREVLADVLGLDAAALDALAKSGAT